MCTVTFIPSGDSFFLTSNRDEQITRLIAVAPKKYWHNNICLLYPKDSDAGGTWISANEKGESGVLLNGGIKPHERKPNYRHSRGLLLQLTLSNPDPALFLSQYDCSDIEPFTIVLFAGGKLTEYIWDGEQKYIKELDTQLRYIWSSVTLYPPDIIEKRKNWFAEWTSGNPTPSQEEIINFHSSTGDGDLENDLVINRNTLHTVSITSIALNHSSVKMDYTDMNCQSQTIQQMQLH